MLRSDYRIFRRLPGMVVVTLILGILPTLAVGADTAKDLKSAMQRSQSKMMSMQFDEAVEKFKQASELLTKLKADEPDHKDLEKLQKQYDQLSAKLAKKIVQRAGRDLNPAVSYLEKKLGGDDSDQIKTARDALAKAFAKHEQNLKLAGGSDGAAVIQRVESLMAQADAAPSASKAKPKSDAEPKTSKPDKAPKPAAATADVKTLMSEIQHRFRDARGLETPELVKLAEEIRTLIGQLEAADPGHAKIAEFNKRIDKFVADAYASDIRDARNEFRHRKTKIDMYLERNKESERPNLKDQRDLLAKATEQHRAALLAAGDEGKQLLKEMEDTLKEADKLIGVALAGDSLVNDWIAKLKTYQWNGDKDITNSVNGPAAYSIISKLKAEAEQLLADCKKVDFGPARTKELDDAVESMQRAIDNADEHLSFAVSSRTQLAEERVKLIEDRFAKDQAWKTDKTKVPQSSASFILDEAKQAIDELAGYIPDDSSVANLKQRMAKLLKENQARQEARKAATLMKPDKYEGSDAKQLREFAAKLIKKDFKDAKVLRVTIFTPQWKEETVTEWTDTTHTAVRTRTTRELMVCLATEHPDGLFRMFGYLNQDRQSSGGWGDTYGHLTNTRDPMLKDNVEKDESE